METLVKTTFPNFSANPNHPTTKRLKPLKVSIKPPPPEFDFRTEILSGSRATVAKTCPELLNLADNGTLILIEKRQFGPVPAWRTEFTEPDTIWLIGTNHLSPRSAADVERVVRAVQPDNVVVELCRSRQVSSFRFPGSLISFYQMGPLNFLGFVSSMLFVFNLLFGFLIYIISQLIFRAGIMYTSDGAENDQQLRSNMFSLSGTGFFDAVGRSINLGGQAALALRLFLALFSSKISSDVNRPFGDEFRAARKVSEEVGAQIVLGDRPIEITLERAWNSLKWTEKLSLVIAVIRGITSSSDMSLNNLKYLAWSLKRSKAVNNSKKVVGVIGKGHMNGVVYALISDQGNLRFRDLAGKKGSSDGSNGLVAGLLKSLLRDTVIGIVLWALYELIKGSL